MKPKKIPGIPHQVKGGFHDTESVREIKNSEDIDLKFNVLKDRFLAINNWRKYCSESSTDFKLFNSEGGFVERLPQIGDYIRIDIPRSGGSERRSFDWVQIISIDLANADMVIIQCRPSKDPLNNHSSKIAHFYSNAATSTFIVSKNKDRLKAGIYGRNEYPNLKSGFFNSIRNTLIAIGGMLGFSKIQWKCLVNGLVDFE